MLHRGFYAILDLGVLGQRDPTSVAAELLAGGCVALQLRAKDASPATLLPLARELTALARARGVPFIINDYTELAAECGADGVHLGQGDLPARQARRILRPGQWVGLSTHNLEQARAGQNSRVDYLGFGPVMQTRTKPDADPVQGIRALDKVCAAVELPVVAIGGLTAENAAAVASAGATAAAAISAILNARDVGAAARQLHERFLGRPSGGSS